MQIKLIILNHLKNVMNFKIEHLFVQIKYHLDHLYDDNQNLAMKISFLIGCLDHCLLILTLEHLYLIQVFYHCSIQNLY